MTENERNELKEAKEKRTKKLLDYEENARFGELVLAELTSLIEERQKIQINFEPLLSELIKLLRDIEKNSASIKIARDDVKLLQNKNFELGQQMNANIELIDYSETEVKELYKAQNFEVNPCLAGVARDNIWL